MTNFDFWKLLAGLGMFIYGMHHLENSVKQIEGRTFKLFLRKHTSNKLSAIFSGTIVTAVLQSSSVVNLMILSFVGADMLSMRNALGVVLGSNIGGTFNSWLVAVLGFKIDLSKYTLPVLALSGIGLIIFKNKKTFYQFSKFWMGFGLLFLGLEFMKESMEYLIKEFDLIQYLNYPGIVFVIIGFVITALIQTSAATVVLVLSALYSGIIPIETAVAIVLGAELGTTIKLLIGSINGIAAKKRVAFGNILFNIVVSVIGFSLLVPIINFIRNFLGVKDPLIILVAFQTLVNIIGVILFYYGLDYFGNFLEKRFTNKRKAATFFLQNTSSELSDAAIEMIEKEVGLFIYRVIRLNMDVFQIQIDYNDENEIRKYDEKNKFIDTSQTYNEKYNLIKTAEGEIISFYSKMDFEQINKEDLTHLNQLMASVKSAMYSAKGMKDINQDRREFSDSENDLKYDIYKLFRSQLLVFYSDLIKMFRPQSKSKCFENLLLLLQKIQEDYEIRMKTSYKHAGENALKEIDISTLFNINRELYSSCRGIIFSLKDYLLDSANADKFENLPFNVK